ncbi:MAG TPA: hypothetical protein VGP93_00665, partial [Polyangiaceae bacterium]|nr:hypothetical protein [Polyangiaceae bacterium]
MSFIVVTAVTDAEKASVGRALAARLALPFYDADDFQPPENRAKLARNEALGDLDRWPWLEALAKLVPRWESTGGGVLCCSALKPAELEVLLKNAASVRVVRLGASSDERALEPSNGAIVLPRELTPGEVVERVRRVLLSEGHALRGIVHFAEGSPDADLAGERSAELVDELLSRLGPLGRVLLIPPDYTRLHSGAGELTSLIYERLAGRATVQVLPALGTHAAMTDAEIATMFPGLPRSAVLVHDVRRALSSLGEVPGSFVREVSGGRVDYPVR